MGEWMLCLLNYAIEHLLLSLVVAPVAYAAIRVRTIAPEKRAAILLLAFALIVIGPAVPVPSNEANSSSRTLAQNPNRDLVAEQVPAEASPALPNPGRRVATTVAPELAALVVALWLAGAGWSLGRLVMAQVSVRRIAAASRRSRALEDAYRHVLPAGIQIHVSPSFGPAVLGFARPIIVLAQGMEASLPTDSLRAVLLHEVSHIKRKDLPVLLLQRMIEAVFWWNPIVRLLGSALDSAREVACDIGASRVYGSPVDYAEALLASIEHLVAVKPHRDAQALCATASLTSLDQRIDAIIGERTAPAWATKPTLLCVGASLLLLWNAVAVAAPLVAMERPLATDMARQAGAKPTLPAAAEARRPTSQASTALPLPPSAQDAILVLHDQHSRSIYDAHDRYSEALRHLTDAYTRDLSALMNESQLGDSDARRARLHQENDRKLAAIESRFRTATTQAEARFLTARSALGYP
jgi:beta-lactamase regulating signal transducer with metallopeptidase domain